MIDDLQVSFPRRDPRATGNFSRAPDLHLLFAGKVFAVEGRFMARHVGMLLPTRGDRRCGANVETVNHSSLNARDGDRLGEREAFRTVEANFARCSRVVRLLSAATETVAATRPLGKRNQVGFYRSSVGCNFTTDTTMEEEAT